MKKILLCLLAVSFLTFISCKKEEEKTPEPVNPAKEFVGDYTMNGNMTINLPSMLGGGTQSVAIPDRDVKISLKGDNGDVTIVSGEYSYEGYVNESGLHVDPIIVEYPIMQTTIDMTVTIPTIKKPVDGTTSFQANVAATAAGFAITGTADIVATKIN